MDARPREIQPQGLKEGGRFRAGDGHRADVVNEDRTGGQRSCWRRRGLVCFSACTPSALLLD